MTNKTESVNGMLRLINGEWFVTGGYGNFPLSKELQAKAKETKPDEAEVDATVLHGVVIDYHYSAAFGA